MADVLEQTLRESLTEYYRLRMERSMAEGHDVDWKDIRAMEDELETLSHVELIERLEVIQADVSDVIAAFGPTFVGKVVDRVP